MTPPRCSVCGHELDANCAEFGSIDCNDRECLVAHPTKIRALVKTHRCTVDPTEFAAWVEFLLD